MIDSVEKDMHRSIEPASRLIVSGLFALFGIVIGIFQISGEANAWFKPNNSLWFFVIITFALAVIVYLNPVRSRTLTTPPAKELRPGETEITTKEYMVVEAIDFYNKIADIYDARLTREYLDTLRKSADCLLDNFAEKNKQLKVLDVGSGTGQFVRQLEGSKRIQWTCIEPATGMAQVLRRFFEGPPVAPKIYGIGLEDASRYLQGEKFDAICLNFVLSSLKELPDFSSFFELLEPQGILLISDGHPDIRSESSSFRMRSMDEIHALNIVHRPSVDVSHAITNSGLFISSPSGSTVTKKGRLYSYIICFCKKGI